MPICDFCKQEKEEVFVPPFKMLYAKDKDVSEVRLCKTCIEFMEED